MKISIITMQNVPNYGSVLQAYATQVFFESMGLDVEFIDYWRINMLDEENVRRAVYVDCNMRYQRYWGKSKVFKALVYRILLSKRIRRNSEFRKFVNENLHISSKRYIGYDSLRNDYPNADIYCTGGDQVWNSGWNEGIDKAFYLEFLPSDARRISFSSSIGKEKIDKYEMEKIKDYLNKYELITVRENSAMDIMESMKINAIQVLDPVFMISKEQWMKLIDSERKFQNDDYILVYQLNDNDEFYEYLKVLSKELHKKIIYIKYTKCKMIEGAICIEMPDVRTFLNLFFHAKYVITDSFHATSFSIIFEKKFQCIFPKKYNTRIRSVLELFSLENRIVSDGPSDAVNMKKEIDYCSVNNSLDTLRNTQKRIFSKIVYKNKKGDE